MKPGFAERYRAELLTYLKQPTAALLDKARGIGRLAVVAGLRSLDLAKLHGRILVTRVLPDRTPVERTAVIRAAGVFLRAVVAPIKNTHRSTQDAARHLNQIVGILAQRTSELAASKLELDQEIARRKAVVEKLRRSEHHHRQSLARSDRLQDQLRQLSRQILARQEDERREISRELHDVIAQTLTGINVRLAALKKEAVLNTKGLDRNIARTQRLVEKSVDIVHQFARELRPAVLDDLGLIPALQTFVKAFSERTLVPVRLRVIPEVEQLENRERTVLYRVAQEALTNVSRHAQATRVELSFTRLPHEIAMRIGDNGKSFHVAQVMNAGGRRRLGLLGMRERLEMVGGSLSIESVPGKGTTLTARIPAATPRTPHPEESCLDASRSPKQASHMNREKTMEKHDEHHGLPNRAGTGSQSRQKISRNAQAGNT